MEWSVLRSQNPSVFDVLGDSDIVPPRRVGPIWLEEWPLSRVLGRREQVLQSRVVQSRVIDKSLGRVPENCGQGKFKNIFTALSRHT